MGVNLPKQVTAIAKVAALMMPLYTLYTEATYAHTRTFYFIANVRNMYVILFILRHMKHDNEKSKALYGG